MNTLQRSFLFTCSLLPAAEAVAHAGHSEGSSGIWHYLLAPLHVAGLLLPVVVVIALGVWLLHRRSKQHQ